MKFKTKKRSVEEVYIDFENGMTLKLTKTGKIRVVQIEEIFEDDTKRLISHWEVRVVVLWRGHTTFVVPIRDEELINDIKSLFYNE